MYTTFAIIALTLLTAYIVTLCAVNLEIPKSLSATVFYLPPGGRWLWTAVIFLSGFMLMVPLTDACSEGTKIMAIAGTLACMLWKGDPYYVQVSRTWYTGLQPQVQEVNDVVTRVEPVSVYELRSPTREMVQVMEALAQKGGSLRKKELIQILGLDRTSPDGGKPPSPQAQHSRLRSRLVPLEKRWGFVQTSELGGLRGRVSLTRQGELALALFSSGGLESLPGRNGSPRDPGSMKQN